MKHKETVHKYSLIFCLMLLPPVFLEHQHSEAFHLALSFAWCLRSSESPKRCDMLSSLYFYMDISILFFTGTKTIFLQKRERGKTAWLDFFFFSKTDFWDIIPSFPEKDREQLPIEGDS